MTNRRTYDPKNMGHIFVIQKFRHEIADFSFHLYPVFEIPVLSCLARLYFTIVFDRPTQCLFQTYPCRKTQRSSTSNIRHIPFTFLP